jgi:hypothetical protein
VLVITNFPFVNGNVVGVASLTIGVTTRPIVPCFSNTLCRIIGSVLATDPIAVSW